MTPMAAVSALAGMLEDNDTATIGRSRGEAVPPKLERVAPALGDGGFADAEAAAAACILARNSMARVPRTATTRGLALPFAAVGAAVVAGLLLLLPPFDGDRFLMMILPPAVAAAGTSAPLPSTCAIVSGDGLSAMLPVGWLLLLLLLLARAEDTTE